MVTASHRLSWLPTVQLGPEADSLSSGPSWTLLTSTSEASPSGLVPWHHGEATKTLQKHSGLPERLAVASRNKKQQPVLEPVGL